MENSPFFSKAPLTNNSPLCPQNIVTPLEMLLLPGERTISSQVVSRREKLKHPKFRAWLLFMLIFPLLLAGIVVLLGFGPIPYMGAGMATFGLASCILIYVYLIAPNYYYVTNYRVITAKYLSFPWNTLKIYSVPLACVERVNCMVYSKCKDNAGSIEFTKKDTSLNHNRPSIFSFEWILSLHDFPKDQIASQIATEKANTSVNIPNIVDLSSFTLNGICSKTIERILQKHQEEHPTDKVVWAKEYTRWQKYRKLTLFCIIVFVCYLVSMGPIYIHIAIHPPTNTSIPTSSLQLIIQPYLLLHCQVILHKGILSK